MYKLRCVPWLEWRDSVVVAVQMRQQKKYNIQLSSARPAHRSAVYEASVAAERMCSVCKLRQTHTNQVAESERLIDG